MKLAIIFATLLSTIICCDAQESADVVTVEVVGIGKDAEAAEKNALYQAVEQAVGAYVDNETVVKNEEVIYDKLLTVAQGFVQSFDVLSVAKERRDGSGIWEIKIKAIVKKSEVGAALRSAGVMQVAADGTSAWAAQITKLKSREDAMALLEKVIPEIPRNLVLCKILQEDGNIQTQEDPKTGGLQVIVNLSISINLEWWKNEAFPALNAAYSALNLRDFDIQTEKVYYKPWIGEKYTSGNGDKLVQFDDLWHKYGDSYGTPPVFLKQSRTVTETVTGFVTEYATGLRAKYHEEDFIHLYDSISQNRELDIHKVFKIPSDYKIRLEKIESDTYYTAPKFTLIFIDNNGNNLHKVDYDRDNFPVRLVDYSRPFFLTLEKRDVYTHYYRFTDSFLARLIIPIESEVIKSVSNIIIKPGLFGVYGKQH